MTDPLPLRLADAFARFGPSFMHWMKRGFRNEDISIARMRLLWALDAHGAQIMSELRDQLGISARSVTSLVDGLEADGYARRTPHPDDRRATVVELTEDGEEAIRRLRDIHRERAAVLFERLDPADQGDLLRIMGQLADELGALTEVEA